MNARRITLVAALGVALAACSTVTPTAPVRTGGRRAADSAAGDTVPKPPTINSTPPSDPVPPPTGDPRSPLIGTGA